MLHGRRIANHGEIALNPILSRIPDPLRKLWGVNFLLVGLLLAALALRLYGIDWDEGRGFHPDERSFYMRAGDMLCILTAGPEDDGPYCSAAHLRSLLSGEHFEGMEPGLPDFRTALSAERSPLNPRWFPLGSALIYALALLRSILEPFVDWGVMELRFAGRTLAAVADVGSVWLLYLIGRRMYGPWVGVLAAAFAAFAVVHIQHTHFYRPEPFTVLASLGALWAMLRFVGSGRARDAALLGALVGLAMAPKVSVAPILAPLTLTFLWVAKDRAGRVWSDMRPADIARVIPLAALAGSLALATFFVSTPYALLDFANFIGDIREQAGMAGEAGRFPFTWQYADTPAFVYQIRQTAVWGLGLPLGILAWFAVPFTGWLAWRGGLAQRSDLLLLAWVVPAFVFLELFEVKFLRYVFPLLPFCILMAARMLVALASWAKRRRFGPDAAGGAVPDDAPFSEEWHATPPNVGDDLVFDEPLFGDEPFSDAPFSDEWHATPPTAGTAISVAPPRAATASRGSVSQNGNYFRRLVDRYAWPAAVAVIAVTLAATVLYAIGFVGIYGRQHTALAASEWINANVPPGASIINGGSFWDEQIPDLRGYRVWTFPAYHPDRDPNKIPDLIDRLAGGDYLVFYSNRAYGSVSRLPNEYPQSSGFYRLLFAGDLGYELERAFTSYPSLLGVHLRDDPYRRAGLPAPGLAPGGDDGQPGGIAFNLGYADENVIGYDHPQVLIFRNVGRLGDDRIGELIAGASATAASQDMPLMLAPAALEAQRSGGTWSQLFNPDGWANRAPWLSWLLAIELICLAAFPLTWWLMRPLADRGVLFARILGLLLVAWVAWWLVESGVLRFSIGAIWLAVLVVAAPSAVILWFRWREMLAWLRERWRFVLGAEALFLLAYLGFTLVRAANPDLWHPWRGGEKPMELAYFTAVARSSALPPYDPWFSGGYLNYYYWGYFILSVPMRLTGIPPATAFNVAVPLLFAMTATGVGSLAYNLVSATRGSSQRPLPTAPDTGAVGEEKSGSQFGVIGRLPRPTVSAAAVIGLVGGLMAAVAANLDGVVQLGEMLQRRLQGMAAPRSGFDFWRSSRAIPEAAEFVPSRLTPWLDVDNHRETAFHITEFPFFTFLFADLHAHMMTMPFAALALAAGFTLMMGLSGSGLRNIWPWAVATTLAISVGSLWAINSWEYPAYAILMLGCIGVGAWLMPGALRTRLAVGVLMGAAALCVSYIAFLPFHAATETFGTGIEPTRWRTPVAHYLLIHALPLLAALSLLAPLSWQTLRPVFARRRFGLPMPASRQWMLVGLAIVLALAGYFVASGFITAGFLTALLAFTLWSLSAAMLSGDYAERRSDAMALGMLALALAIGIGVDFIRVEGDIARMNTLFKYYLVAWLLFAAAGAYGLWRGWAALSGSRAIKIRRLRWAAAAVVGLVAAGTLVYPALATPVRIADRFNPAPLTLDGAAWMPNASYHPPDWCTENATEPINLGPDHGAIRWLQDNVRGTPVVLEAHGNQYCWNTRISQYTGLPTVLGWPWHQQQQRNDGSIVRHRARDVETIYSTLSHRRALELLGQYDVAYIVVGELERIYYPENGIAKFDEMVKEGALALAYSNDGASIYRVVSP